MEKEDELGNRLELRGSHRNREGPTPPAWPFQVGKGIRTIL